MPPFNTVPGLVPLKIYSGSTLLTTNVNLINFTGSGVTTTVNAFNGLTVTIGGGGTTVDTGSLLTTASFSNPNLTFTKGDGSTFNVNLITLVPTSASYAATASVAISASYAPITPPFPYTGSAQITGSLGITGSLSLRSGSNLIVFNGLISASYGTNNLSVGGTPGWTSGTRNTSLGLSNQGSVTTQTDNTSVGYLSLLGGNYNTAVGSYAAQLNTGDGNVALGYYALGNQTSNISYNIAIGYQSMFNASGSGPLHNISLGYQSMYSVRGANNIAVGYRAGFGLTTGYQNIFLGYRAGLYTSTSGDNVAIGYQAGLKISGSDVGNILIGTSAGGADSGGATLMGSGNVGIGVESLLGISSSAGLYPYNVAIGFQSGRGLTTGAGNILLGGRAGWGIGRGTNNILMGTDVGLATTTQLLTSNIGLGVQSFNVNVSASYNIAIGISALSAVGATASGANNGSNNVALGYNAGSILKTGVYNIFIGSGAGRNNSGNPISNGSYTTFIGAESGVISTNGGDWGNYSVGIGYAAIGYNGGITPIAPGAGNTGLGAFSLTRISSSVTTRNTAVGYNAGVVLNVGANNTFVGSYSGQNFATGSYNILIGDDAGGGIVSGSRNTIIGSFTGLTASLNDTLIIGTGTTRRIFVDSAGSGSWTGSLTVTGPLTTNNSFLYTSSAFQTTLDPTGFKLTNIASGSQSASIQISGNGTLGGASYIDFLRVTNTSASATNPNKSFRVSGIGDWEVINSAYTTTIFSLTDAGVLFTPGGGTSDRRTKDNINYITENATYTINQLQPAEFEFKNNLGIKRHGFIAQDVLEIKPDLVLGDGYKENGTYGLDYDGILALTVKALQEANTRIDKLEKTIEELKNK